jgi:hypothetical protein
MNEMKWSEMKWNEMKWNANEYYDEFEWIIGNQFCFIPYQNFPILKIQIYKYTNIQIYKYINIQIYKYTRIQICKDIRIQGSKDTKGYHTIQNHWIKSYASNFSYHMKVWMYKCMHAWVHESMKAWKHESMKACLNFESAERWILWLIDRPKSGSKRITRDCIWSLGWRWRLYLWLLAISRRIRR